MGTLRAVPVCGMTVGNSQSWPSSGSIWDRVMARRSFQCFFAIFLSAITSTGYAETNAAREYTRHDFRKSFELILIQARKGSVVAENDLGKMYFRGQGVERNYGEAIAWFTLAANGGYAEAQSNLGVMYRDGLGTERDDFYALMWFRLAAAQNFARAQYYLGTYYEAGRVVHENREEAKRWYQLAADRGDKMARAAFDAISNDQLRPKSFRAVGPQNQPMPPRFMTVDSQPNGDFLPPAPPAPTPSEPHKPEQLQEPEATSATASTQLSASPQAAENSCLNVISDSLEDSATVRAITNRLIEAIGTFRIEGELNENKQPDFNLTHIECRKQDGISNDQDMLCILNSAIVEAKSERPNYQKPNCSLNLIDSTYSMKQLTSGVYLGIEENFGKCFDTMLTIDLNLKRVSRSFRKNVSTDQINKTASTLFPNICKLPPSQTLMNCTAWAKLRQHSAADAPVSSARYCDFTDAADKIR